MSQVHHLPVQLTAKNKFVKRKRKPLHDQKTCKVKFKTTWPTKV